ncbi:WxL domain-containing protein [uncultured Vagococcus sp.]|uniref:WxL domain-containing protein n=1 Tax=uncultured Vagococcus sp. TaxID=189676 RepID=UPI0028D2DD3A|nr:WxL domain-containing protein [uncultured Vagococcus sp.]
MKTKLFLGLATIMAVGAVSGTTALAADNTASKTSTDVGIGFKSDDDNSATEGPFKNNLAMVFRPTEFSFGMKNTAGAASTFSNTIKGNQYIVVNDDRSGTDKGQGWKVKAQMTELTSGTETLANATLSFGNGAAKLFAYDLGNTPDPSKTDDYLPNKVDDEAGNKPNSLSDFASGDNVYTPGDIRTLKAGDGSQVTMLEKKVDAADKVGGVAYQIENVKLDVVDTAKLGGKQFTGSINWTLEKNIL